MALKKICPGCGKLIDYSIKYCNECSNKYKEKNKIRHKQYKANRTDEKEQRFYVSKPWLITRETIKARDKGLCRVCLSKGDIRYMNTVHHIEELKDCWDKRLDPSNLISVCESCHQEVHNQYKINKLGLQNILKNLIER
ncbi:HNH endonuclease [Clostridium botulinum]|uniref:HNH endonuclease signature motif containing protein n=1 Tax=Clostridium botulinum TaxID=1491 RepID=UPI000C78BD01|nr:HNH endonuclease signature motif containing protein [Clostridium botulinum]AUM89176.1 HNH endonuclease [Clostridium botulinum]